MSISQTMAWAAVHLGHVEWPIIGSTCSMCATVLLLVFLVELFLLGVFVAASTQYALLFGMLCFLLKVCGM